MDGTEVDGVCGCCEDGGESRSANCSRRQGLLEGVDFKQAVGVSD
jgi:hypothetical protein